MDKQLNTFINYIDENIKASSATDIPYIDDQDHLERLRNKQNHVLFGRRGTGKTILSNSLGGIDAKKYLFIKVNLEQYKGTPYPNILLKIVDKILYKARKKLRKRIPFYLVRSYIKLLAVINM